MKNIKNLKAGPGRQPWRGQGAAPPLETRVKAKLWIRVGFRSECRPDSSDRAVGCVQPFDRRHAWTIVPEPSVLLILRCGIWRWIRRRQRLCQESLSLGDDVDTAPSRSRLELGTSEPSTVYVNWGQRRCGAIHFIVLQKKSRPRPLEQVAYDERQKRSARDLQQKKERDHGSKNNQIRVHVAYELFFDKALLSRQRKRRCRRVCRRL